MEDHIIKGSSDIQVKALKLKLLLGTATWPDSFHKSQTYFKYKDGQKTYFFTRCFEGQFLHLRNKKPSSGLKIDEVYSRARDNIGFSSQ
ncbi:hypothetical protein Mapa_003925 [Marchantia paleacea]|nr:hypothetical protein Mapa_003925 [Marchantia paleacea]